ncbi:MAG: hypothetical protein ACYCZI_02035 [Metallibacterium scheffleri]
MLEETIGILTQAPGGKAVFKLGGINGLRSPCRLSNKAQPAGCAQKQQDELASHYYLFLA